MLKHVAYLDLRLLVRHEPRHVITKMWRFDNADSDEPVQPPVGNGVQSVA